MILPMAQLLAFYASEKVLQAIRSHLPFCSAADRRIGEYILENPDRVVEQTSAEVAQVVGVSEATLFRFLNHIGYSYHDLRNELLKRSQLAAVFPQTTAPASSSHLIRTAEAGIRSLCEAAVYIDPDHVRKAAQMVVDAPRVQICGIGPISAPVAEILTYKLNRLGCTAVFQRSLMSDATGESISRPSDVLVAISHSGENKQLVSAVTDHVERGGVAIAISNYAGSPLADAASLKIVTGVREPYIDQVDLVPRLAQMLAIEMLLQAVAEVSATDGGNG